MRDKGRPLTSDERALAASMFGTAIDYDRVRIHAATWWPFQPKRVAMAPDGHIWLHPQGSLYCDDFTAQGLGAQGLFIHEMTHVWQAQVRGRWYLPLMRHPFCRYGYSLVPGRPFERYGLEQQAEIVKHAFLARNGVSLPDKPPIGTLEALLPFTRE
ncbi:hypothetical protein SCH01S_10_00340 [Sphingomonas changbaiensis NBRC 104936]|uniref:Vgr related protein n=1 Tax=Sphingomonas changbaiensis NBRC 104936 TaxID=1219043 RepID=A0A0E9ML10_9SPHN|nr:hypothetical protein [Sphingomonas changbaiensis]GAO38224.1 hypothetical protein SCH01S_10_00340 [Sphingomonas changbaiensis NBRC 104936]